MKNWVDHGMYHWISGILRRSGFRKMRDHRNWVIHGEATWRKTGAPFWFRIDLDQLRDRYEPKLMNFNLMIFRSGPASPPEVNAQIIPHIDFHREIVARHNPNMPWNEVKIHYTEVVRLIKAVANKSYAPALAGIEWAGPVMEELLK